ncbi:ABC transporter ATP-binding protein [Methanimicrococcus blatticola]|uniref:Molybdate/tungstate import ATP-binding protein WtpC n=1 Tax=Methanimicrococcus blatticola TaxID=91560 RepID=A0A484F4U9_9EURY|nr:ABC transporter ATP-binding protein [Methanimicrococcus blatticola]MBZ3935275.1 ABC transporter ATP-binding protein [Methanimicrococcus blatticola]MCC2508627.1 ABC transporter ATP-binding protein [Methanimicrococcus blatticola]TDQ67932.1 NitT/TauT family transport system ATP-binding protein [Methanimicrococcus blatticola]
MGDLIIENLSKEFKKGSNEFLALKDINLSVKNGEFVTILGPSGCGKTTLLRIIAGLETYSSGTATLDGELITGPGPKRGMVFQEYSLFPWKTVLGNVMFGPLMQNFSKDEAEAKAMTYLNLVGLSEFKNSYPYELSGGMKQRVAIARALANEPEIILMDEPFGALDAQTRNNLQNELLRIWQEEKRTIIFVTHSVDEAVFLSDRIVILSKRPGTIKKIIEVSIPRPRDRTRPEENAIRNEVLRLLDTNENCEID